MLGAFGLLFFGLGMAGLSYLGVLWLLMNVVNLLPAIPIGDRPLLAYSIALTLLGAQGITLGLLAELIVAYTGREADTFSVSESVGSVSKKLDP